MKGVECLALPRRTLRNTERGAGGAEQGEQGRDIEPTGTGTRGNPGETPRKTVGD